MVISKSGDLFIIRIYKDMIHDFDMYDTDSILELFKIFLVRLKDKYGVSGLCSIDVYVNEKFGVIVEVNNICKYDDEIDVKVSFHIDSFFLVEINFDIDDIDNYDEIYYYKGKYYANYNNVCDSNIIYANSLDIVNKGIRVK